MTVRSGTRPGTLLVGAAMVDITPDFPVSLAGFGSRQGALVTEVADPLSLQVTVLESDGSRIALVAADLLSWGPELVDRLRPMLAARLTTPADNLTFVATHTHSGPQTAEFHAPILGAFDPRFLGLVTTRALAAADRAASSLEPATVHRGIGSHDLGRYRRGDQDPGPTDDELTTVAFRRDDGSLIAAWVHYTCHPVINATHAMTPDFAGLAAREVAARTGGVVSYLQGCCGDQNPQWLDRAGIEVARREGGRLAEAVLRTLDGEGDPLPPALLTGTWSTVDLPFRSQPTREELLTASRVPGVEGEWGSAFLAHPERLAPTVTLLLQRLDVAEGLSLLAMNAEVCVAYGLAVRESSQHRCLPVGYANGIIGYLPTAAQIAVGGYEPVESARCYLLPGLFAPEVESLTLAEIRRLT